MIPSIRTFLLINLLLGITVVFSLAVIGNIVIEHKTLYKHFDSELTSTAFVVRGVFNEQATPQTIKSLSKKLAKVPELMKNYSCLEYGHCKEIDSDAEKVQLQIWKRGQGLLLKSNDTVPELNPIGQKIGFYRKVINNKEWRYFVLPSRTGDYIFVTAERYLFRDHLREQITQNSLMILLLTYPFLGLLIWIIIGRGLASIKHVTKEVQKRAASNLKEVNIELVPPEIKPLVDELNQLFAHLYATFQREKRFASDAAHELRTPLAALKAQTQVALNSATTPETRAALEKIILGVDRSTHIVQQLLTLSRMLPDTVPKQLNINLNSEAKQIIADLAPSAMKKRIEIELQEPNGEQLILGNAAALSILIRNLVDNAIRYTPEQGSVKVIITGDKEQTTLQVIDNGPGIPAKLHERVFERFFRIVGSKAPGSGLGLSIAQQIAEIHNAKIELLTPKSGKGLEVKVTFKKSSL